MKAIIFDMDGTLVDTEKLHALASRNMLEHFGVQNLEDVSKYSPEIAGKPQTVAMELYKRVYDLPYSPEELLEHKTRELLTLYETHPNFKLSLGVQELLEASKAAGIPMAIASSSPMAQIEYVIRRFDLEKYFSVLVSGASLARPKPFPDIFLETAKKLAVPVEECLIFEDSEGGVEAGLASGAYVIGYNNPETPDYDLSKAPRQINSFEEIRPEDFLKLFSVEKP